MVPSPSGRTPLRTSTPSRRTLLRTSGVLIAAGLAGCELRHRSEDGSGDGSGSGSGDGSGNDTTTTVPPDATYDLQVENRITAGDLDPVDELSTDTPATITVEVEENYMDRDDVILFEQTLDLAPEETRTYEEAFSTTADGPEHVIAAELEPFREADTGPTSKMSLTSAARFEPAGFQAPTSTTFYVIVMDGEQGDDFGPWLQVRNERPEPR